MRRKQNNPWGYLWLVVILGIGGAFGWWFFSPAFIDNPVNEALPTSAVAPANPTTSPIENAPTAQPVESQPTAQPAITTPDQILAQGSFYNLIHIGSGQASIYQLTNGNRILRLENFSVENGPDLYVYLVPVDPVPNASGSDIPGYLSLGALKGNVGDQNYEIPADVDLSQYKSVVIWCQAFAVPFSAAPLTPQ